ncbi:MAG TPA: cupin domain-containing protein [Acidimicrobiia bacterium]|nr:cupin domain-containing protein [Acidimicrobiia bacterium]
MRSELEKLPVELQAGDLVTRYAEWGEMAVRFARVPAGTDMSPVLEGLPNDRCPSPHWGVVLEGSIHIVHADGSEEVTRAGEAYHWPAGHTAYTDEDTAFFEVAPVAAMRQFGEHAKAKLSATVA